ncbi:MAG: hypothetical protein ACREDF_01460 [Thermoplasmata archaeon]
MTLNREQIRAAQSRPERQPRKVAVPEWGGDVLLRVLTVEDQIALGEDTKPADMPVQVLLHCIVDEQGDRILTDEDAEWLAKEDFPLILRLFSEAAKLNGLTNAELEEAMDRFVPARDEQPSSDSASLSGAPSPNSEKSPALN